MKKVDIYYDDDNPPATASQLVADARKQSKIESLFLEARCHGRDPRYLGSPLHYEVWFDD